MAELSRREQRDADLEAWRTHRDQRVKAKLLADYSLPKKVRDEIRSGKRRRARLD